MIELMLCVILFSLFAIFDAIFTHPCMSIALMIVWVWVYKECKKNE